MLLLGKKLHDEILFLLHLENNKCFFSFYLY